jgi:ubiquitin-protein ligase
MFSFIVDYPFKPPVFKFLTIIFHPNVNTKGKMCSHCIGTDKTWNPNKRVKDLILRIIHILKGNAITNALRLDVAEGM